jgi:outer membrane receptor protein involved in Fe transport
VEEQDQVLQRDRDFSACSLSTAAPTVSFACGGSGTSYPGQFTDFGANDNSNNGLDGLPNTADDVPDTNPLPSYNLAIDQATGDFRDFDNNLDQYNFGPVNHFMRPSRRYNLGAIGHYELNDHADVYTQLMYTNYRSIAQIAPGGIFFDASTINCDNPFLSAQQGTEIGCDVDPAADESVPLYIGRRNVEGGGREQSFRNAMFRGLVGVRGDITTMWQYDVSAQFSSTSVNTETRNYFVIDRILRALDVVTDDDGNPQCRSFVDGTDPVCVPYNVFDPNGVTPEALTYLQAPGIQTGTIDQEVYIGQVTGDLGWTIPTAADSIKMAFGAEYRRDSLVNSVDALQSANRLSGAGGATIGIEGATKVIDLFTEVNVPLIQDKMFADHLAFDGAYRHSDYSNNETDTYKLGLDWAPIQDVRFRASFQHAVRAANVVELFTAQGFNLFDMDNDPCGPGPENAAGQPVPNADATLDECMATGMPASAYRSDTLDSPAGQYNFLQGGDPALVPEDSDTRTFGIILQPRFLPNFTMTVDYFNIKIEDTISTIGPEVTLNACYTNNDPVACERINRNPLNGALWIGDGHIVDLNTNIGSLETTGYDVTMNYAGLDIGKAGSLSFALTGTYLDELVTDPGSAGTEPYDCAGKFAGSCASGTAGVPSPKWRHHARIGWQMPWPVDLSLTWRYYGEVEQFGVPSTSARIDRVLGAESYFDLAGNWSVTEKASVMLGINNVLDNDPSINASVGTTGNGNTYPQLYDALGRYIFVRGTIGF